MIFDRLKVRHLVLWMIPGFIILAVAAAVSVPVIDENTESIFLIFLSFWELAWLMFMLRRHGVALPEFIGDMPRKRHWGRWISITLGLVLFSVGISYTVFILISFPLPELVEEYVLNDSLFHLEDGTTIPVAMIILIAFWGIIVAPFAEELLFRGFILQRWARKWGMRRSVIFSSLLFGALHLDMVGSSVFAFVMCVLYLRTRSIWVPVFCHVLNNASAFAAIGVEQILSDPSVLTLDQYRSEFWIGLVCLTLSLPWVIIFIIRNWPAADSPLPFLAKDREGS